MSSENKRPDWVELPTTRVTKGAYDNLSVWQKLGAHVRESTLSSVFHPVETLMFAGGCLGQLCMGVYLCFKFLSSEEGRAWVLNPDNLDKTLVPLLGFALISHLGHKLEEGRSYKETLKATLKRTENNSSRH